MSNAFDDFKKWYELMQAPESLREIANDQEKVRRNISEAAKIISDLRNKRITEAEAKERAMKLDGAADFFRERPKRIVIVPTLGSIDPPKGVSAEDIERIKHKYGIKE